MSEPNRPFKLSHDTGTVDAENPWPGLLAFREVDQAFFRGRQFETEMLERLVSRRMVSVLYGLSGLGKSSLLQAGLFPRSRAAGFLPIYIRFDFSESAADLAAQARQSIIEQANAAQVEAPAFLEGDTLWEYFHRRDADFWSDRNRLRMPLLVFDQFEELFTLGRMSSKWVQRTEALFIELADLAEGRPPRELRLAIESSPGKARDYAFGRHHYKILFSLREDFLPELEELRPNMPSIGENRMRLRRMNGEAANRAVNQAAGIIEAEVAERMVRFVAATENQEQPLSSLEVEPSLLSVICRELNNKRRLLQEPQITIDLLDGSRAEILSDFYERSLTGLPTQARTFVEDDLITASGYRDSVAVENALERTDFTQATLDELVARRLVRIDERNGTQRIELTHDLLTSVVASSRDERRHRDEEAAADEARAIAERRAADAVRRLRRSRMVVLSMSLLFMLALGTAVWGFLATQKARKLQVEAEMLQAGAEELQREAEKLQNVADEAVKALDEAKTIALAKEKKHQELTAAWEDVLKREADTRRKLERRLVSLGENKSQITRWLKSINESLNVDRSRLDRIVSEREKLESRARVAADAAAEKVLVYEKALKSVHSRYSVHVTFRNSSAEVVNVYWVDYRGKEKHYKTLQPNSEYVQQTYATHPWRLKAGSRVLGEFTPTKKARQSFEVTGR